MDSRMPGIMVKAVVIVAEITIFMKKKDKSEFLACPILSVKYVTRNQKLASGAK
jgi:hypothetical protein